MIKSIDEDMVINLYNELYTIRHIAELVGVDHHRVKRILIKNNIILIDRKTKRPKRVVSEHTKRPKKVVSEHTRKLISEKLKGRKKNPHLDSTRMKISITNSQIGLSSDTAKSYPNANKTLFLIKLIKKNTISRGYKISSVFLSSFINKFYNDVPFNSMYDDWILNKKNKWYRPSLDHILSISKYRNFDMDNMRIITWFENRSKSNMHINYWVNFKQNFEIKSKLFIENDHILYDQNIDINEGISKANYQYFRDYIQTDEERRKNFIQKYDNSIPISALNKYENFNKFLFIGRSIRKRFMVDVKIKLNTIELLRYIDHFYNDRNFNKIYDMWIDKKYHWIMPSLDHKISLKNKGATQLDNLRYTTLFENYIKCDMSLDEWEKFKIDTQTSSILFV